MSNRKLATDSHQQDGSMSNNPYFLILPIHQGPIDLMKLICTSTHSTDSGRDKCMEYFEHIYLQETGQGSDINNHQGDLL